MQKHLFRFLAFLVAACGVAAQAQTPLPSAIRGAIASVDGATLDIRTRAGEAILVRLKGPQTVVAVIPASRADIKPGVFVGAAVQPAAGGAFAAMEVHIFPESARGTGEGTRPYDLAPGSVMTNANVTAIVEDVSGPRLTLTFKGGEQTVLVGKETPIVMFTQGTLADLKQGASVVVRGAAKAADGVLEATRITVGRDGLKLPM